MKRTLLMISWVIALAGCSAAATAPSETTPTVSPVAFATDAHTLAPEPTPTPSATPTPSTSVPSPITVEPTAVPTLKPTTKATPKPTLVACPTMPVTIDQIAASGSRAPACFGGALLTFDAYVPRHPYGIGDTTDHSLSPAWLNGLAGSVVGLSAGPDAGILVLANVPPALGRCDSGESIPECPFRMFEGRRVLITARFDDPVARTCRAVPVVGGRPFSDAAAVTECRRLLVVQSIGPDVPLASHDGSG